MKNTTITPIFQIVNIVEGRIGRYIFQDKDVVHPINVSVKFLDRSEKSYHIDCEYRIGNIHGNFTNNSLSHSKFYIAHLKNNVVFGFEEVNYSH